MLLSLFQIVFEQLFHRRVNQVNQPFLVNHFSLKQLERQIAAVFHEDGAVAVRVYLDYKVIGELFGNELDVVFIFVVRIVVRLHQLQIQRCQFFQRVFNNQCAFFSAAAAKTGKLAGMSSRAHTCFTTALQDARDAAGLCKHGIYLGDFFE